MNYMVRYNETGLLNFIAAYHVSGTFLRFMVGNRAIMQTGKFFMA